MRKEKENDPLHIFGEFYEWLGCWILTLMFLFGIFLFYCMCIISYFRVFAVVYVLWIYYDRGTPHKGGRRLTWIRKIRFWKRRRDYFPIRLIKTTELPPNTTYLFSSFPHGIGVFGGTTNFLSDVNNFDEMFPGLTPYVHMQNFFFHVPIVRDLLLFFGVCSVSSDSIQYVLNGPPGNVSIIIVGGYAEMMKSLPGTNRLVLKNRKGFVRMALKTGSFLVPVFSFGENDAYDQMSHKWYVWLQEKLHSAFTLGGLLIFKGPFKIGHLFGLLPYQRPITTVVGSPIRLPKVENPSSELVDKFHRIFVQQLTALFNKYKIEHDSRSEKATLGIE